MADFVQTGKGFDVRDLVQWNLVQGADSILVSPDDLVVESTVPPS